MILFLYKDECITRFPCLHEYTFNSKQNPFAAVTNSNNLPANLKFDGNIGVYMEINELFLFECNILPYW